MRITDKLIRYKVIELHIRLVKECKYFEARKVLKCLNDGSVKLGLDDISWAVETELEKIGCRIWYAGNGNYSRAYCFK